MHPNRSAVSRFVAAWLCLLSVTSSAFLGNRANGQIVGAGACEEVFPVDRPVDQQNGSTAFFTVDFFGGLGVEPDFQLKGPVATRITRNARGGWDTEIVAMSLTGTHPTLGTVQLTNNPRRPIRGRALNVRTDVDAPNGPECTGDVFFDVFFDITVEGGEVGLPPMQNAKPLRMQSQTRVPLVHTRPFDLVQVGQPVVVFDANGGRIGQVANTRHTVNPIVAKLFKRGDASCDGCVDEADAEYVNDFLFRNGPPPCCFDAADANDDGAITLDDAVYILNYVSAGGPAPPAPGPDTCGRDPTPDDLPEGDYPEDLCDVNCKVPSCYPPAGKDVMQSTLLHDIDIPGFGLCRANLAGPVCVQRSDPYTDPATGLQCIDTVMTDLRLVGRDPVCGEICITLDPCFPSRGKITEKVPGTCFPANSYFDVRVKIELKDLGLCFYACQSARMQCMINELPPFGCLYNLDVGDGDNIPLYRGPCTFPDVDGDGVPDDCSAHPCNQVPLPTPSAYIIKAVHQPLPPDDCTCFPPAGTDTMQTTLFHEIDIPGLETSCTQFAGPITVRRGDSHVGADGRCYIRNEIIRLEMTGTCANGEEAKITLCPDMPSRGYICQIEPGGPCFPALSCFQVFFQIQIGDKIFKNCRPAIMCCNIDALPPVGCAYGLQPELPPIEDDLVATWMRAGAAQPGGGAGVGPIEIYEWVPGTPHPCFRDPAPRPAGFLLQARHDVGNEPEPCCPEYGPGHDILQTTLLHDIVIPGLDLRCEANLRGQMVVERGTPYVDPDSGLCCVDTRAVRLELNGVDPNCGRICITLDPRRPSRGRICAKEPGTCFPANSHFEMNVRIELKDLGLVLTACQPAIMRCMIDAVPPIGCMYQIDLGPGLDPIPLYEEVPGANVCELDPRPDPVAFIDQAVHQPDPPCEGFPAAGEDVMQTELSHRVRLFGLGPNGGDLICDADMIGPTTVDRSDPYIDPDTGLCCIDTEIVAMRLEGNDPICGPVIITPCPDRPSTGQICAKSTDAAFPANSFFDVYMQIEIPNLGIVLKNCAPVRMECMIDQIPPFNCFYQLRLSDVPLYRPEHCAQLPNADIQPVGQIEAAAHVPRDPCDHCPEYGPGRDVMDARLLHRLQIFGVGECNTPVDGKIVVERGAPFVNADGLCCVTTRMVQLEASAVDPLCGRIEIKLCPDRPSRGFICEKEPGTCFPANSCFDMNVEVHLLDLGLVLKNCDPIRMCCMIDSLPPYGCNYQADLTRGTEFFRKGECDDPNRQPAARIITATHRPTPCPPARVECTVDPATGQPVVRIVHDPDCEDCERIVITRTDSAGGSTTFTLPAGTTSFVDSSLTPDLLRELCAGDPNGAALSFRYCAQCVIGGVPSRPMCCTVTVPCPPTACDVQNVNCDHIAGTNIVQASWGLSPNCECEEIHVTCFANGVQIDQSVLLGTATSYSCEIDPNRLAALCANDPDGVIDVQICVQCRGPGFISKPQCCSARVSCPETACDVANVRCDPIFGTNRVAVAWDLPAAGCECDRIIIRTVDSAGNVVDEEVALGNATSHEITIERWEVLCRESGAGELALSICVTCEKGGAETKPVCCDVLIPCPPKPCVVGGVRCTFDPDNPGVGLLFWSLPADCPCDELLIRCVAEDGTVITQAVVPGNAQAPLAFDIPLEQLCDNDLDGEITIRCCIACRLEDGQVSEETCCSLTVACPPTLCDPEVGPCRYDPVEKVTTINWTTPDDCACDKFLIRCLDENGNVVGEFTVEGDVRTFSHQLSDDLLRELCANDNDGVLNFRYCVQCLVGDDASKPVYCDVRVPCVDGPCDPRNIVCRFDEATGMAVITWDLPNDPLCKCDRIILTRTDEDGNEVHFALPGDATSYREEVPVDVLCRRDQDGIIKLNYCVRCVFGEETTKPVCCDLEINCPDCDVQIENCRVVTDAQGNDFIVVNWIATEGCCQSFVISVNGEPVQEVPGAMRTVRIPCPGPGIHTVCVQCLQRDGTLSEPVCCEVECPDDCKVEEVNCDLLGNGPGVVVNWATGDCECDRFQFQCLTADGRVLFEEIFPGDVFNFEHEIPGDVLDRLCDETDEDFIQIRYCVACVKDGQVGEPVYCDVRIPCSRLNRVLMCDVNGDGQFDLGDAVTVLSVLFLGQQPGCGFSQLADANGNGAVDLSDAIRKLQFLFLGGPPPVTPDGTRCLDLDCPETCPL